MSATAPTILAVRADAIPEELKALRHWIVWIAESRPDGKINKVPHDPRSGLGASHSNPGTWGTFAEALTVYETDTTYAGIGYVVSKIAPTVDEFTAVDLDRCVDPDTGQLDDRARGIVERAGSYTEITPSGTGLRIFVRGRLPDRGRKRDGVEIYDTRRMVTITGHRLEGSPTTINEGQGFVAWMLATHFPSKASSRNGKEHGDYAATRVPTDKLLDKARSARGGDVFARLWDGTTSDYGSDHSRADAALCRRLAFWTGPDRGWIDDLFRESGLYREKWERDDYRGWTLDLALEGLDDWFEWNPPTTHFANGHQHEDVPPPRDEPPPPRVNAWPEPPDRAAFYGLAGDIVRVLDPATEADPAALLLAILQAVGNIVGAGPHWQVGGTPHGLRLNVVLVGGTSKGRKGTTWGAVKPVLRIAAPEWLDEHTASGLSSGEGLIFAVRDPITKHEPIKEHGRIVDYEEVTADPGVDDKRLLVVEEEFGGTLKLMGREGNILSAVVRQAWDTGDLRTLTKTSPTRATGAHISVMGHITKDELLRYLDNTEAANGFANRFLWPAVRRSKILPDGGVLDTDALDRLAFKLQRVLARAASIDLITRDPDANEVWHRVYGPLSEGGIGLMDAVLSRAEAQVMRLASIYAVLDGLDRISRDHLSAALALWDFLEASARHIFGDALGDPVADAILTALRQAGEMTRNDIVDLFGRNVGRGRIDRALGLLRSAGKAARYQDKETGGRPREVWRAN